MIIDSILELLKLRRIPVTGQGYIYIRHYRFAPNYKGQFKYGRWNKSILETLINRS